MSFWGIGMPEMDKVECLPIIDRSLVCGNRKITTVFGGGKPSKKSSSSKRIGPHNLDVMSILIGSLLGDCHLERRGLGSRFCFQQESSNKEYLLWFHSFLSERGYTPTGIPSIQERIGNKGKKRKVLRFKTWTYSSFNWVHTAFYIDKKKIVPYPLIQQYLTPLALAVWIKDDGSRSGVGLKLSTNSFTFEECTHLKNTLDKLYNLKVSIHKTGVLNQHCLYIHKGSMSSVRKLIKPFLQPSKYYKLNI